MAKDGLQRAIDKATNKSAREFFSPAFKVGAAGYGIAPQPTNGTYLLGGGLAGFGATCDWDDVKATASIVEQKSNRPELNEGLRVTARALVKSARSGYGNCNDLMSQLQQILDAMSADLRATAGLEPFVPRETGGGMPGGGMPGGGSGGDATFFSIFYDNGKLTNVGIGTAVVGGLLVLATTTGVLGRVLRKR
jgi:hypothetical protein